MEGWFGATFLLAGFLFVGRIVRLLRNARNVFGVSCAALAVMGDPTLGDDAKEQAMQRNAVRLFALFMALMAGGFLAVAGPLGLVWLADQLGWLSWQATMETAVSLGFVAVVTTGSLLVWWAWRKVRPAVRQPSAAATDYSAADRLLHRTAFASVPVQIMLSGLEDRLYRRRLAEIELKRPVFVAGLPRSGTTLVLELCHQTGAFATHTYRQMPFVLNPLIWNGFSDRFRRKTGSRERAHGDGMMIAGDSPEALEEVIWMAFWKNHYGCESIRPWALHEEQRAFLPFFRGHLAKILALGPAAGTRRYLSKNNLNIARLGWLLGAFPDARFVVPFRDPRQHAASLLRQHGNFLTRHREDPFSREYMAAIGHFEFGANLRPIDFDGWLSGSRARNPETPDFWLAYWTAAYRALLREWSAAKSKVCLLDFDALCLAPERALGLLAGFLELDEPDKLTDQAAQVRPPREHAVDPGAVDPAVLEGALTLHAALRASAHACTRDFSSAG